MKWFAMRNLDNVMWCLVGVMALALIDGHAVGQCELNKLLASDGVANDFFGESVSVCGNVAVVGATKGDGLVANSGTAYVYRFNGATWGQEQELIASDGAAFDEFGLSVSVSGEVAVVGSPLGDGIVATSGSAYVYRFDGVNWVEEQKLIASDGAFNDRFGFSVSISGDLAVVGAWRGDGLVADSGSVYIYRFDGLTWVQEVELIDSDGALNDRFGYSVSVSGAPGNEAVVVGVSTGDGVVIDSGSAYIYRFNGVSWLQEQKLIASDGAAFDNFGFSVSISSDVAVVGVPFDDGNAFTTGSVYVFRYNGAIWMQEQELIASDAALLDLFGQSVSVSGNVAVVGAKFGDGLVADSGSAYVYIFNGATWGLEQEFFASDGVLDDWFGISVSVSGDVAVVGASLDDDLGSNSGSARMYVGLSDCNGNGVLDCLDFASGTSSDINMNFVIDDCELLVYNTTAAMYYTTIDDAIRNAVNGDVITASPLNFVAEPDIEFFGKDITLSSLTYITQTPGGLYTLAAGSTLAAAASGDITLNGELRVLSGEAADVIANQLTMSATSELSLRNNSALFVTGAAALDGQTLMLSGATLDVDGALTTGGTLTALQSTLIGTTIANTGIVNATNLTLVTDSFTNTASGSLIGYGTLFAPITNDGAITCIGDTVAVGDYLNNALATTTVQVGTLTIVGNLTNFGTIFGNISVPPSAAKAVGAVAQSGDGMSISGNYTAGATTSLMMPDAIWVFGVGGNFDVAINDNTNYDMRLAQLRLDGLSGAVQNLELMSLDIGAESAGLDRLLAGHYPIGTLRIGPNATTVTLVDNHDNANDGQLGCEALYVENLIVNAAATLNTNGCRVYYETLVLNGLVDDPLNLIALPLCLADVNKDSSVNVTDLLLLLGAWGPNPGHAADLNDDGNVNVTDLLALLAAWGACP